MLTDRQLSYLLVPVILCWLVISVLMRRRQPREPDPIKRAWINFRVTAIGAGIGLVILWLALGTSGLMSGDGNGAALRRQCSRPSSTLQTTLDLRKPTSLRVDGEIVHRAFHTNWAPIRCSTFVVANSAREKCGSPLRQE
jgi:hypothetical protein